MTNGTAEPRAEPRAESRKDGTTYPSSSLSHTPLALSPVAGSETAVQDGKLNASPVLIHAGSRARLILEGERMHIELAVVCLESGSTGRSIRVTGLDHRQTYTAQIVDAALLKGNL